MNPGDVDRLLGKTAFSIVEMVNSTPSCIKIITRKGELLTMNARGLSLIEATDLESVTGANVYDLVEESHRESFIRFNESVCDGEKGHLVFEIIGLCGSRRWMESYAAPYTLANGETAHIAITNDITEKVQSENEILKQRQALANSARLASLGQFVGGIAHEINNPLTVIHGKLSLLKMKQDDNELDENYLSKNLDALLETTERISDIIQNLKSFTRDTEKVEFREYEFSDIVNETLSLCQENFRLNNVKLDISVASSLTLKCEKVQISQVLMNLLNNAFDAVQHLEEKWVKVKALQQGNTVTLSVTDSGQGIDEEIANQMLNPFYTTKEIGKGTGLGLSLSSRIVDHHRGRLYYSPESENTRFIVELPAE